MANLPTTPISQGAFASIPQETLVTCSRRAYELHVLVGAIASMATPAASLELKRVIQLAGIVSEELNNELGEAV